MAAFTRPSLDGYHTRLGGSFSGKAAQFVPFIGNTVIIRQPSRDVIVQFASDSFPDRNVVVRQPNRTVVIRSHSDNIVTQGDRLIIIRRKP